MFDLKWSEITIHTTNEATEAIANIFHEAGASGVVIEDSAEPDRERDNVYGEIVELDRADFPSEGIIIKAYLPINDSLVEATKQIDALIANLPSFGINIGEHDTQISEVDEEDSATAWKKYYHPVNVSNRFTIVPTWEEYDRVKSDELIIELDPGMAFGTGTHATTVMCLQALEKYVKAGDTVVDVGTGSGVLSIGAALLGAKKVQALDLDYVAVTAAKENIVLNKVDDVVQVEEGNLLDIISVTPSIIVANILADVIMSFSADAAKILPENGLFIVSGIIGDKEQEVKNDLIAKGFDIIDSMLTEDWVALIAQKKGV